MGWQEIQSCYWQCRQCGATTRNDNHPSWECSSCKASGPEAVPQSGIWTSEAWLRYR